MITSLSGPDAHPAPPESGGRRLARHAAVAWLLVVQPVALALTLDRALPRIALLGAAGWLLIGARIALAGAGIAVARRLRAHEPDAWRAAAIWFAASIGTTLLARAWPVLPTPLAPSEARLAAIAAVARDAVLALAAAWLARTSAAVTDEAASARESS